MTADRFVAVVAVVLLVVCAVFVTVWSSAGSSTVCQEITIEAPLITPAPTVTTAMVSS